MSSDSGFHRGMRILRDSFRSFAPGASLALLALLPIAVGVGVYEGRSLELILKVLGFGFGVYLVCLLFGTVFGALLIALEGKFHPRDGL